tara:strand:+ start:441 stop:1325 length:885 start_codon:yes stop_codon:yes gene_type:complete
MNIKPQKALHLHEDEDKKKPKHVGHRYIVTEKKDGWYGYYDSDDGHIRSRAGRIIPSLADVSQDLHKTVQPKVELLGNFRIIFEILLPEEPNFYTMNGILNRKEVIDSSKVELYMHDLLLEDNMTITARGRYTTLSELVRSEWGYCPVYVQVAHVFTVSEYIDTWKSFAEVVWGSGGEGVILKRADSLYSSGKRNADLMKIKEEITLDLLVIGVDEGEGKYQGTTGALIVRDKAGNRHHVSGMTDEQRDLWWNSQLDIVGSVVEVKAMKVNADGSLREPRFKAIRHDKTSEDID